MRPPPAFQCYASDSLAREAFRLMSLEERGLLFTMMLHAWVNDSLPAEPGALARVTGDLPASVSRALTPNVMLSFQPVANGRLICPELATMKAQYADRHDERSRSGRKGARSKWAPKAEPKAELEREPLATPELSKAELSKVEVSKEQFSKGDLSRPESVSGRNFDDLAGPPRPAPNERYVDRTFNRDDDDDLPF